MKTPQFQAALPRLVRRFVLCIALVGVTIAGLTCNSRDSAAQSQPTEIVELARALKNNPDLIYEYVYNNIETLPQYGSLKGPLGTLLDGKGTPFDQAELMIALLQQSGITAAFVTGEILLSASQLTNWLGVDNSLGSVNYTLGTGGFPATPITSGGVVVGANVGWAWVQVNIGGTDYLFNPATKTYSWSSGLTPASMATALGYSQSAFVANALSGSSTTLASITGVNRTNIRNDIGTYANNLVRYIRSTGPAATTADIIGGKSIVPLTIGTQLRQTTLPLQVGPATVYSSLPTSFRTTLTLQLGSNDSSGAFSPLSCTGMSASCQVTYNSSDIYGHRIVASFNASGVPSLLVDGVTQVAATTIVPSGRQLTVRTSVVHPYPTSFADLTNNDQIRVTPFLNIIYLIGTGWGPVSRGMIEKHRRLLQDNIVQNPANPAAEPVLGESLAMLGYTWLAEIQQRQSLVDPIAGSTTVYQHSVGVVGTKQVGSSTGPFVDLPINTVGIVQRVMRSSSTQSTPIEAAAFFSWGVFLSIAESGVLEQTQPGATAASTVKLIDTAVQAAGQIFDINNSAIPGDNAAYYTSTIRPTLSGSYGSGDLARIDALVANPPNLRVIAPASGAINIDQYTGAGYFQISQDGRSIGAIITGGLSGGEPASPVTIPELAENTPVTVSPSPTQTDVISNPGLSSLGNVGGIYGVTDITRDPINLVTGDYLVNTIDLATGSLDMPYGLAFQRYYDSGTRLQGGPLGFGWTHGFATKAAVNSDAFEGMAINSPVNGAAAIAATFVTLDILNDGVTTNKPLDRMVIASVVQRWLMDQLKDNIVAVAQPGYIQHFVKLADGTYNAPLGVGAQLKLDNGAYAYTSKDRTTLSFNSAGDLSTWATPAGVTISLAYSGSPAKLSSVTNNLGRSFAFTYASDRLVQVADDSGRSVSYAYDASGNLVSFTDPIGNTTTYAYGPPGQLTQVFYPSSGNAFVTNTYDALGRVRTQANANGATWQYFFAGSRSEEVDALGMEHVIYVTPRGRTRLDIQDYDGLRRVTSSTYDGLDRLTSTTLPEGGSTAYTYDTSVNAWANNIASVVRNPKPGASPPPSLTTSFTYDPAQNKPLRVTDPRGVVTSMAYDPFTGNLLSVAADTAGLKATTRYTYNGLGLVTSVTDPVGTVTRHDYDTFGNRIGTTADAGPGRLNLVTTIGYNAQGDPVSVVDPRGSVTTSTYDAARRRLTTILPGLVAGATGITTANTYDADGRLLQVQQTTADGSVVLRTTSATYTPTGKPATATDANGNTTSFAYDPLDRRTTITDPLGRVTQFAYTVLGQPFQTYNLAISVNPLLEQTYTADGLPATLKDANGNTTTFAYDRFDRLATTTYPLGSTETFTYDANGNVLTRKTRAGATIAFAWDNLNRLTTKTPPSGPAVAYTYDLAGRPKSVSDNSTAIPSVAMPASTTTFATSYAYDALNRLTGTTWDPAPAATAPAAGSLVTFTHAYNKANQRIAQQASDNTWLSYPAGVRTTDYNQTPANPLNQYTTIATTGQPTITPTYDGNGNLTSDGTYTLGYDVDNRLVSASGAGNTASYAFDAQGRRKSRTVNGTTTLSVTDADNREVLEYDGSTGAVLRWYSYALGPNAVLNQMNVPVGTRTILVPDLLGSIIGSFASSTGALTKFGYQPYGTSAVATGPFGFTGQRFDQESGLYYYRARHYSPAFGRFLQTDPIGYNGGTHLYSYVGNDPINLLDPTGLNAENSSNTSSAFWSSTFAPAIAVGAAGGAGIAVGPILIPAVLATVFLIGSTTATSAIDQPPPQVLYHYTTPQGMAGIVASQQINPSLRTTNPTDVRFGEGQYFTDIPPGTRSNAQISRALIGLPFQANRFSNYVAVDVQGLPVVQGRPNVFVVPNTQPLNIEGRLNGFGVNQLPGSGQ